MLTNATVADVLRPCTKRYAALYDITLVIIGSLFIAIFAHLKIILAFSPVPITGQTFAVLMLGALLGSRRGSLSVLFYLTEGAAGLPVFAAGGGLPLLFGPTGGYLFGFIPAAYVVGLLAERGWDRRCGKTILAMLLGNATIYTFGLLWLFLLTNRSKAVLQVGLYPFIIGDILKTILAAILLPTGWKLLDGLKSIPPQSDKR